MGAIFSYASADAIELSSKTFGQLKAIVARVIGAQAEADAVGAGDAIHMAIDKFNEYEWEYLTVWGADATVAAGTAHTGTAVIACPTHIKKIATLRWNGRPLNFARAGDYDKVAFADTATPNPTHYTWHNTNLGGEIELLPRGSGIGGTVEMKLYRPISKPSGATETLDIMQWMERALILEAQTQLMLEHGDDMGKVDRLQVRADRALAGCLGSDRAPGPQEDSGFVPFASWGSNNYGYPADHAWPYVIEGD